MMDNEAEVVRRVHSFYNLPFIPEQWAGRSAANSDDHRKEEHSTSHDPAVRARLLRTLRHVDATYFNGSTATWNTLLGCKNNRVCQPARRRDWRRLA